MRWLALALIATTGTPQLVQTQPSCQFNIVSATVVAAYCGHREGDDEVMDVVIAWRGQPGWFQRRDGMTGSRGSRTFAGGLKGRVSQAQVYGGVTLAFDADFDAGTVLIGAQTIPLKGVNTILIDDVERPEERRVSPPFWIEPRLPLSGDVNLALARRSPALRSFLRCEIAMPAAVGPIPQPPVITVCEKLAAVR
jgi:hypothetical protein